MLINNSSEWREYQIYIIDGQNITQIKDYQQMNNTNKWNPCIPMPFAENKQISIIFADNGYNSFRKWYPLQICDFPNSFVNYRNEYLFDGGEYLIINNLNIQNYIINDTTNYPIAISKNIWGRFFSIHHGVFSNISSATTDPLFYSNYATNTFNNSLFSNISAQMIFYHNVKLFCLFFVQISCVIFYLYTVYRMGRVF